MNETTIKTVLFAGKKENFDMWSGQFENFLIMKGYDAVLERTRSGNALTYDDKEKNKLAYGLMTCAIGNVVAYNIVR
jgi:hypothetical protein